MKTLILGSLILLTACKPQQGFQYPMPELDADAGPSLLPEIQKSNEPEIEQIQQEFIGHALAQNYTLPDKKIYSKLGKLEAHILGQCRTYSDANVVIVDSKFWQSATLYDKRSLIFHELGHCLLNRGHRTLYYQGPNRVHDGGPMPDWDYSDHQNWPVSLMHQSLVREVKFKKEEEFYLHELFSGFWLEDNYGSRGIYNCRFE